MIETSNEDAFDYLPGPHYELTYCACTVQDKDGEYLLVARKPNSLSEFRGRFVDIPQSVEATMDPRFPDCSFPCSADYNRTLFVKVIYHSSQVLD